MSGRHLIINKTYETYKAIVDIINYTERRWRYSYSTRSTMKFSFQKESEPLIDGRVIYRAHDFSFDFEPKMNFGDLGIGNFGVTSLAIDYLQLEIDVKTNQILYVWGLCPYQNWLLGTISPPKFYLGKLFILEEKLTPGITVTSNEFKSWVVRVNPPLGWVCVGEVAVSEQAHAIEFATHTIAVIENDNLKAIWLYPEELPKEIKSLTSNL